MHLSFISMRNVKRMHFDNLFTMYGDYNLMQHSQHCQEISIFWRSPLVLHDHVHLGKGIKNGNHSNHFPLRGGGLGLFLPKKMGVLVQTTVSFYGPFYLKNVIRGGHLTEYALNLFQFCFIPIILGLAQQ